MVCGRELERNFVFVVVRLVVAAEAHEHGQLVVGERGGVLLEGVGVDEHLDALVLAQVERGVAIDGLRLAVAQVVHGQGQCLLVALHELRLRGVGVASDARRQHVVHGSLVVVFLDVHCAHHHFSGLGGVVEVLLIDAPFAAHQVERAEAHDDWVLEIREEHTHEANRREVANAAHPVRRLGERDAELIPSHSAVLSVAQRLGVFALIHDVVAAHDEVFGTDGNLVLIVFLVFVERVVLVDVLDVGRGFVRGVVALGARVVVGRVALRIVDVFVATNHVGTNLVVVRAAEIVVVVVGRVVHDAVEHGGRHLALNLPQEILIRIERALLFIVQAVQTHVLQGAAAARGGKGIGDRRLRGNLAPLRERIGVGAIHGHSALVEFLAVVEHVFAHLAEVDVEVAAIFVGVRLLVGVEEGVEQPEFDVFDVGGLEIGGFELAHHTAPVLRGVVEASVLREVGVEVVGSALVGIVRDVQNRQRGRGSVVVALVAGGEEFVGIDLANVEVRELVEVALDVAGREARRAAREERVDGVPRHLRAVEAAGEARFVATLGKHSRWYARQEPRRGRRNVNQAFRLLEVVDVRGVVLRAAALSGDEMCELARERDVRGLRQAQERQLVEQVREPLAFLFPIQVHAPNRVFQWLGTHRHLRRVGLFRKVLQRTAHLEILREIVGPVHAEHRFSHLAVVGVALERHVDGRAGIENALIEDGHLARAVVHGVVAALGERHAARRHHHRALRHVVGTERDDVGRSAAELSRQHVFVLLCNLLRHGHRRVVELGEGVARGFFSTYSLGNQVVVEIATEWLGGGEEDAPVLHGVALHVVETSVGMGLHIVV